MPKGKKTLTRMTARPPRGQADFEGVFARLKSILERHAAKLFVKADEPHNYYLETQSAIYKGKRLFFGAAQIKKNYVSFHLMHVYGCPELLKSLSPELKKRMQGKACFNFTATDEALFKELGNLVDAGLQVFLSEKFISSVGTHWD